MNDIDVSALGQALNTTWGRQSSDLTASRAVSGRQLVDSAGSPLLRIDYMASVNFGEYHQMRAAKDMHKDEAIRTIKAFVDKVKKEYKETTGSTLTVKERSQEENVEIISAAMRSPVKRGYYKFTMVCDIS